MASKTVAQIRPQSSRTADRVLAYIDDYGDEAQNILIYAAIRAAIALIADSNDREVIIAADVLRLARDRLETWLFHRVNEEVSHG
jgi:hypothetical protein